MAPNSLKSTYYNINWRDVQTKNVVNNVDMSCLRAPWQNGPYKNKHKERHKNSYNIMTQQTFRQTIFLCLSQNTLRPSVPMCVYFSILAIIIIITDRIFRCASVYVFAMQLIINQQKMILTNNELSFINEVLFWRETAAVASSGISFIWNVMSSN